MARRRTTTPAAVEATTTDAPEEVTTDGAPDTSEDVQTRDDAPQEPAPAADDAGAAPAEPAAETPPADAPPADAAPSVSEQPPAGDRVERDGDRVAIFIDGEAVALAVLDDGRLLLDNAPAPAADDAAVAAATARADLLDVEVGELRRQLAEARTQGFVPTSGVEVHPGEPPVIPSGVEPKAEYDEPSPYVIAGPPTTSEGWGAGQVAPADRYGITAPDGTVTPTGRNGLDEPPAGAYGALLIRKGDTITPAQLAAVGLAG